MPTSGDGDSSGSEENDRLSVRNRSPILSLEGLEDDILAPGTLLMSAWIFSSCFDVTDLSTAGHIDSNDSSSNSSMKT